MSIGEQRKVIGRLAGLATQRSLEIKQHSRAVNAWKREHLSSTGSLALFFAAGFLWNSGKEDPDQKPATSTIRRSAASMVNVSLLLWRLFSDPIPNDAP